MVEKNPRRKTSCQCQSFHTRLYLDWLIEEDVEGVAGAVREELLRVGGQHPAAVLQFYSKPAKKFLFLPTFPGEHRLNLHLTTPYHCYVDLRS
jgi:hypothetical protein